MADTPTEPVAEDTDSTGEIVCRTTRWYFNRMGLMFLMVIAFSGWFLYDGLVKYPKQIELYSQFSEYDERSIAYEELESAGRLAEWGEMAKEKGWDEGKPVDWVDYAEENGLPEKPDKREVGDENEQFFFAGLTGVIGLVILVMFLMNRSKVLRADGDSLTAPGGERVKFSDVFRVDKRKWRYKGLAYLFYKTEDGSEKRVVIDDLKFGGADKVLDRLMATFEGELIDRIEDEEDEEEEEDGAEEKGEEAAEEVPEKT